MKWIAMILFVSITISGCDNSPKCKPIQGRKWAPLPFYENLEDGLECSMACGKPVLLVFTCYTCVGTPHMIFGILPEKIKQLVESDFILVALHTDDRTALEKPITTADGKVIKHVGNFNKNIQAERYNNESQPLYAILNSDGKDLVEPIGYTRDEIEFIAFLVNGKNRIMK